MAESHTLVLLPGTGRAARVLVADTAVMLEVTKAVYESFGDANPSKFGLFAETQRQTILHQLCGITSKAVPVIWAKDDKGRPLDGKPKVEIVDGKEVELKFAAIPDEEAMLRSVIDDEAAKKVGVAWVELGQLDLVEEGPKHYLKVLSHPSDWNAVWDACNKAKGKSPLPFSGKTLTVAATE
jgi:hypothetical protein